MSDGTVLLDTNIFTAQLNPRSRLPALYRKHLVRARLAIPFQVVGEARFGALQAGWQQRRLEELERLVRRVGVLPVDDATVWAYAELRLKCLRTGHPLHQKNHNGDLWIAATSVRWEIPLVAHDGVFKNCPGLDLRTEVM